MIFLALRLRLLPVLLSSACALGLSAQGPPPPAYDPGAGAVSPFEPPGVAAAMAGLTSQPSTHTGFTFDRDMLDGLLGNQVAGLNAITVQTFHFSEPAFYVPEAMNALRSSYYAAGWKHLVEANVNAREEVSPQKPITDVWFHFLGTEIDDVAVLIRSSRQMDLVEVSGHLRPLDLVHLGGHFGIPKVDPEAVMVPAAPGR